MCEWGILTAAVPVDSGGSQGPAKELGAINISQSEVEEVRGGISWKTTASLFFLLEHKPEQQL